MYVCVCEAARVDTSGDTHLYSNRLISHRHIETWTCKYIDTRDICIGQTHMRDDVYVKLSNL